LVTAGAVALLLVVGATAAAVLPSLGRSAVPRVIGLNVDVARTRLAQDGLKLQIIEHRFSPRPAGLVLVQMPAEGTRIRRSEPVRVVVSAGTEEFTMPDVIGDSQLLAKGILETKGLDVRIETSPSAAASDTVLSTNPGPGQIVHTGDIVRVVIAAAGPSNAVLLPYDLRNVTVVIDPEPVADGQVDIPLDVARRLRSLIEASRGKVIPTRALADTGTAEAAPTRAQRATAGTSTVGIGLSIVSSNPSGVIVFSPIATLPQTVASGKLSASIVSALAVENIVAKRSGAATDTVLGLIKAPWARLQLGSYSSKSDVAAFTDPAWEDSAARGLYRAIGEQYGKKGTAP
jgi:N-acetylmuramoyl-L-alanine amidase